MKKNLVMLAATGVTGIALAAAAVSPAFAWHPKGSIVKYVQNVTTGSQLADANDEGAAVAANPGDTLEYVITVKNDGQPDSRGWNDMAKTKLSDTLPQGVELISNPSQRTITEDLGTIKPGKSVTKKYQVKVTSKTNGDVITNKACFTGDSTANDNPQKGCDTAVVKVSVPEKPEEPETPTTPEAPKTPDTPAPQSPEELPSTGAANIVLPIAGFSVLGYAANLFRLKRKVANN